MKLPRRFSRAPGDRGAVAALLAVLLSGNVVLGMAALTIDVGLLYAEREELQTGADAAAVAVAKVCVGGNDLCTHGQMIGVAENYADDNAHDGSSNATMCGFAPSLPGSANLLPPCGGGGSGLTDCIGGAPSSSQPYVEVRTDTQTGGGGVLPPVFAQTVTGTTGTKVHACSRVSWGPVEEADDALAIAISESAYNQALNDGDGFQPPPDGGHEASSAGEVSLSFRTPSCDGHGGGGWGGGCSDGFGFLTRTGGDCARTVQVGGRYDGLTPDPGGPGDPDPPDPLTPDGCVDGLQTAFDNRKPIPVAVFDDASSRHFRVAGIAAFVVTGWHEGSRWSRPGRGSSEPPTLRGVRPCSGDNRFCIYGYFTTRVFETGTGTLGDDHYGAVYVRTIG